MTEGDSFLPRIQSVFYAVFDVRQGSKIVYQVPEGLIGVPSAGLVSAVNGNSSLPSTPSSDTHTPPLSTLTVENGLTSRNSTTSLVSPLDYRQGGRRSTSHSNCSQHTLFHFNDISMYVIPPPALCGRLVSCTTRRHRIIGFPVELKGKYERNYFRYNLCFVFEREADLSCYEPIVRKVSRVLKACEEESGFLSSLQTSPAVHAILEQLYEDLNSYSETSILIDQFNSIELKIFPFYPNPPQVKDWMVPLALINLAKRIEENWDLTVKKVAQHINGVNHVSRIAHLADCDISFTRQAISHLLYYQVIMTIDIFQYSNMYTVRKSIQWLADESHVKEECGPYVTKPGRRIADWPKLLHLYSRLKPGKSIYEWMKAYSVEDLGVDVRRFTSFGVIKGFLRRVHRYPVYLPSQVKSFYPCTSSFDRSTNSFDPANSIELRKRAKSPTGANIRFPVYGTAPEDPSPGRPGQTGLPSVPLEFAPFGATESPLPSAPPVIISQTHRARRASAAEKVLEQLRGRDILKNTSNAVSSPRTSWINGRPENIVHNPTTMTTTTKTVVATIPVSSADAAASSTTQTSLSSSQDSPTKRIGSKKSASRRQSPAVPPPSPIIPKHSLTPSRLNRQSPQLAFTNSANSGPGAQLAIPSGLLPLLDGEHHTDELSVRFEAGWPLLEQWLVTIGGGQGDGDFGRVVIIYK